MHTDLARSCGLPAGALPALSSAFPLGAEEFARLAGVFRPLGLVLMAWNHEAFPVYTDGSGPRFWNHLLNPTSLLRRELASVARQHLHVSSDGGRWTTLGPFPEFAVACAPVRLRTRAVGVITALALTKPLGGDALARLCDFARVDAGAMQRAASEVRTVSPEEAAGLMRLLALTVDQSVRISSFAAELDALASNLGDTYEELNLVYRISGWMRLPQHPVDMLERVGREVLEVSRTSAIAFVLSEQLSPGARTDGGGARNRVIVVGRGVPNPREIDRLAESLPLDGALSQPHLLLNDAAKRPELAWAAGWLKHLVTLPLTSERRLLGVLLAINCTDGGDFTSVDVQLLRAVADRVTLFLENQHLYNDLADLLVGLLRAMVNSIDAKDQYTCGHSERVAYLGRVLARAVNLPPAQCQRVYLAGLLHDVGKIGVPDAILSKPGKLTTGEFDILKKHTQIGARILAHVHQIADLLPGVLHHHERIDGKGYPDGLSGDGIPLLARILCVADCFDAMTTNRTYRAALPLPSAIMELRRCAGTQFDPELVERFIQLDLPTLFADARALTGADPDIGHFGTFNVSFNERPLDPDALGTVPAASVPQSVGAAERPVTENAE